MKKPTLKKEIDWSGVIDLAQYHLDRIEEAGIDGVRSDADHYIFEEVLEAIYGDNVWEWYNEQSD